MSTRRRQTALATLAATVLAIALLAAPGGATAAAITVANGNDSGPGSLRQALLDAGPGGTVTVPPGNYTVTSEPLQVPGPISVVGAGPGATVVQAGAQIGVFAMVGAERVTIAGLTVRGGHATGGIAGGGGIRAVNTDLTLERVAITENVADATGAGAGGIANGGGVYVVGGSLAISDSTVAGNRAVADGAPGFPGGIAQGGGLAVNAPLTAARVELTGNLALSRGGSGPPAGSQSGGIAQGGGLFLVNNDDVPATISAATISGNLVDVTGGPGGSGGIGQGGGAFVVLNGGSGAIANATVTANAAVAGSGLASGGGLYSTINVPEPLRLSSGTFVANSVSSAESGSGGNLYASKASIVNSIVSAGSGPIASSNCAQPLESAGFNIESLDQCGLSHPADRPNADPHLGPLADNGGPVRTMAPQLGGPAIDQGTSAGLAADARGLPRPVDFPNFPNAIAPGADGADIGAYELQPASGFTLRKIVRRKRNGTALVTIDIAQPTFGTLALWGRAVVTRSVPIAGQGALDLVLKARGGALRALRKRGRRKVGLNVTYAPGVGAATTQSRTFKLVRKKKHKKKSKKKRRKASKRGGGKGKAKGRGGRKAAR